MFAQNLGHRVGFLMMRDSFSRLTQLRRPRNRDFILPHVSTSYLHIKFILSLFYVLSLAVHSLNIFLNRLRSCFAMETFLLLSTSSLLGHQLWPKSASFKSIVKFLLLLMLDFCLSAFIPKLVSVHHTHREKSFRTHSRSLRLPLFDFWSKTVSQMLVLQFRMFLHDALPQTFLSIRMVLVEHLPSRVL